MCQHIMIDKGNVMSIQTLKIPLPTEVNSPFELDKIIKFDKFIRKPFGDPFKSPVESIVLQEEYEYESYCEGISK